MHAGLLKFTIYLAHNLQDMVDWGADFGPKTLHGQWWRTVTCMFLHFGIFHLGFNMWVLWNLGDLVERLVGNVGFLVLYFVSGIAGSLASLAWDPLAISAGASGAVFGVAGALLGLIAFRHDSVPAKVLGELRASMGGFLLFNVFYGITHAGIDMAAHLGGLAAGFVCGLLLSQPISAEMMARRKFRNGAAAATFAIVLPFAAIALPDAPPNINEEMQRFGEIEERVLARTSELWEQAERGAISDVEFAAVIQSEILSPWLDARRSMEEFVDAPYVDGAYLSGLVKYMQLREESWQLTIEALQEEDPDKHQQADEKWLAAEAMVDELTDP
jgi:rhomboid protease GluP